MELVTKHGASLGAAPSTSAAALLTDFLSDQWVLVEKGQTPELYYQLLGLCEDRVRSLPHQEGPHVAVAEVSAAVFSRLPLGGQACTYTEISHAGSASPHASHSASGGPGGELGLDRPDSSILAIGHLSGASELHPAYLPHGPLVTSH